LELHFGGAGPKRQRSALTAGGSETEESGLAGGATVDLASEQDEGLRCCSRHRK
jgi:hypothetical protein